MLSQDSKILVSSGSVLRSNIKAARGSDTVGPTGHFAGYFRPPVSSDYTFVSVADDNAMVWMNLDRGNASKMELIIDFIEWLPLLPRDWYCGGPVPSHRQRCSPESLSTRLVRGY